MDAFTNVTSLEISPNNAGNVSNSEEFIGLQSTKSTHRLNQIDKVRANGVGDHIALPQLVVCGDQSAGKSSVFLDKMASAPNLQPRLYFATPQLLRA